MLTRREFASFAAKAILLAGLTSAVPLVAGGPILLRRPPGAVEENTLRIVCVRCGRCVAVCSQKIIRQISPLENLAAAGTPVLLEDGVCNLDLECASACPSGALQLVPREKAKIGTAKIERGKCIGCGHCVSVCRPIAGAASMESSRGRRRAMIDPSKCLGCGACVQACPVHAIQLSPEGAYRPPYSWPNRG